MPTRRPTPPPPRAKLVAHSASTPESADRMIDRLSRSLGIADDQAADALSAIHALEAAVAALGPQILSGNGSPEAVVVASPGRLYVDLDGGASVTLWVKESGDSNIGWIAK